MSMRRSSYASVLSGHATNSTAAPQPGFLSHSKSESQAELQASKHHTPSGPKAISGITDSLSGNTFEPWPDFFIPSYLRRSRHMERLADRHRARAAAHKGQRSGRSSIASLSRSTSSANLHKIVPSHRGMTYEIQERPFRPTQDEEVLPELPSHLSASAKAGGIELAPDGSEAKFNGPVKDRNTDEGFAVRADLPMPRAVGVYYYEITVLSKARESPIAVGFATESSTLSRPIGWEPESWAYHGDDGLSFCQNASGKGYGHRFGVSDVIGCGVNFKTGNAFFTKNGVYLGTAFRDIKHDGLYPVVGFKKAGEHIRINFGQTPFVFDIDGYVENERDAIRREIEKEDITSLHEGNQERLLEQELIAQYLAHDGFVEAAKAFATEVQRDQQFLRGPTGVAKQFEYREDPDAIHRHQIRSAIIDGDIDRALDLTNQHYPLVLTENENIYFKLKCRKFIEMIRRCTELQPSTKSKHGASKKLKANGRTPSPEREVLTHEMEIDASDNDEEDAAVEDDEDEAMEPVDTADTFSKQTTLTNEALKYGQELNSEFRDDPRTEVKQDLKDTFALIGYPDARESSLAPLLRPEGRIPVAEELNGAILVSLGKSSNATLERLYQQTEVLVNDLGNVKGGDAASLINVRSDYLR